MKILKTKKILLIILLTLGSWNLYSRSFEEASAEVRKLLEAERKKFSDVQQEISAERRDLRKEVKTIRLEGAKIQERIAKNENEISSITSEIDQLASTNFSSNRIWERIWDSVKFNLTEFTDLYTLAFPEKNDLKNLLKKIASTESDASELTGILEAAFGFYAEFFAEASRIEHGNRSIYNEAGEGIEAQVLTAGLMGGTFQSASESGIVYRKPGANLLHSQSKGLSKSQRQAINAKGHQFPGFIPVHFDLAQGKALGQLKSQKGWKEFFESGGLVMYPLTLIGIIAILIILERIVKYILFSLSYRMLQSKLVTLITEQKYDEAQQVADAHSGGSRNFWRRGVELIRKKAVNLEEAFHHLIIAEIPGIERFLSTLAVFAAICPLLGLLGTVSGMIKTFDVITLYGTGNSGMMAQGISEALVTTEVGLILAIPILLAHSALSRKAKSIIGKMDQTAGRIVDLVKAKDS